MPFIKVPKLSGSHPLVLANAVHVRLIWTINSVACSNILGGSVSGGFVNSQAHADSLAANVVAGFTSSGLKALTSSNSGLDGVGIRDLRTANQAEYTNTALGLVGTGTADALPNQLAAVVTLRTAMAGKSFRGRVYIPGADEDENDVSGRIVGAYNTAAVAFVTAVAAAMATEGINLCVLSAPRYANLVPPLDIQTWPGALTPVTSITARDNHWDSQNRRDR